MTDLSDKLLQFQALVRAMGRVVVAFSAGVDSTLVLRVCLDVLGKDNVLAATGVSPSLAERELQSVRKLADILQAPLELVTTSEMDDPRYTANGSDRCYFCKSELYSKLSALAQSKDYHVVVNGLNADDPKDHGNGLRAGGEHAIRSPLLEAGLTKADVRALAHQLHLPNWEKPALACLSSRIPYGTPVTIGALNRIEKAERFLIDRGFRNVRVRHHTNLARVEVDAAEIHRLCAEPLRSELIEHLKSLGYVYVTIDLQGFRSGSGNEVHIPRAATTSLLTVDPK